MLALILESFKPKPLLLTAFLIILNEPQKFQFIFDKKHLKEEVLPLSFFIHFLLYCVVAKKYFSLKIIKIDLE